MNQAILRRINEGRDPPFRAPTLAWSSVGAPNASIDPVLLLPQGGLYASEVRSGGRAGEGISSSCAGQTALGRTAPFFVLPGLASTALLSSSKGGGTAQVPADGTTVLDLVLENTRDAFGNLVADDTAVSSRVVGDDGDLFEAQLKTTSVVPLRAIGRHRAREHHARGRGRWRFEDAHGGAVGSRDDAFGQWAGRQHRRNIARWPTCGRHADSLERTRWNRKRRRCIDEWPSCRPAGSVQPPGRTSASLDRCRGFSGKIPRSQAARPCDIRDILGAAGGVRRRSYCGRSDDGLHDDGVRRHYSNHSRADDGSHHRCDTWRNADPRSGTPFQPPYEPIAAYTFDPLAEEPGSTGTTDLYWHDTSRSRSGRDDRRIRSTTRNGESPVRGWIAWRQHRGFARVHQQLRDKRSRFLRRTHGWREGPRGPGSYRLQLVEENGELRLEFGAQESGVQRSVRSTTAIQPGVWYPFAAQLREGG